MKTRPTADELAEGPPLRQAGKNHVQAGGQRLLYFAGCDYFRFARHPAILAAIRSAVGPGRLNVAASRLTTGNHPLYHEAEARVAEFFGAAEALLLNAGYVTNLVVAQALAAEVTHVFADEGAHVCLADAASFLACPLSRFPPRDAAALRRRLQRLPAQARPLVMTDGMFSRDGAVAPLRDYLAALPARGWLLVDDAHGAGTLGAQGRGTPEFLGVRDARLIQTLTFSKAFGVYGGAVVCPPGLRHRLVSRSPFFAGSTPLPLPLVAGVVAALETMRTEGPARRQRLQAHVARLREQWHSVPAAAGAARNEHRLEVAATANSSGSQPQAACAETNQPGPIVPIQTRSPAASEALRQRLLAAGIYPSFIRYPGGPAPGYFRFVLSSEHTRAQVARLAVALEPAMSFPTGA